MRLTRVIISVAVALVAALTVALAQPGSADAATRAQIKSWQSRLNSLHCDAGPADGTIGTHTRTAVIRFQTRHGLAVSGKFSNVTVRTLRSSAAHRCDIRPVPRGTGSGRRIVISQGQNWVWLVRSDGTVYAQGGIVDNPAELHKGWTHTGSYCGRPARVKLNHSGSVYMDDFVRFAPCGIGFHRIPRYISGGNQMHADYFLGTNFKQSHGCIRLSARMARNIWSWTSGTTTRVRVI
ncbi:MAG: murein L,D-transpeptidase [Nocardioides sp.]|nr:murein L,D-transpeptidase [Nocardioides sp.]